MAEEIFSDYQSLAFAGHSAKRRRKMQKIPKIPPPPKKTPAALTSSSSFPTFFSYIYSSTIQKLPIYKA